jgi:hypothetical protein
MDDPFYLHLVDKDHNLYEVRESPTDKVVDTLEYAAARELRDGLNELARERATPRSKIIRERAA